MPKSALVIYNPSSHNGSQSEVWVGKIVAALSKTENYVVTLYPTSHETTPHDLVPLLKPPLDLVIAAGGDGTVRFALAALAEAKSDIPAAILPLGTGNVLARNLGIVHESFFADPLERAFDLIECGQLLRIDLGMMNGEYFAGMAGVGPVSDAFVTPEREEKTKFKMLAYVHSMLDSIAKRPVVFKITSGGKSFNVQASGILIGNVQDLGLGKKSDVSLLCDGLLGIHIINPKGFRDYVNVVRRFAGGVIESGTPVISVKEVVVEVVPRRGLRSSFQRAAHKLAAMLGSTSQASPPQLRPRQVAAMIDGDYFGTTPMRVTVIPNAVNVLIPKQQQAVIQEKIEIVHEERLTETVDEEELETVEQLNVA